jgi:L-malate glycosyltransferase
MNLLYFISNLGYGGAEKQTILDANMMVKGNEVFFVYFTDGPQKEFLDKQVKLIHLNKESYLITAIKLSKQIKENNIQLIHSSLFSAMIISALSSLFCKVKVVWHFHSHEYELPRFHRTAFKVLARLPGLKKICFVSQELLQYYQSKHFNFPVNKIKTLHNNSTFHPSKKEKKENNTIVIGYIGRLVTLKRLEYLIELTQYLIDNQIHDFQIRIIGDGVQRNALEQESQKRGFQNYISFLGFQKDIEKYYRDFDLFLNPSQEECLSIALIDAGVCGIPSVAFDVGGNNEIILNSQTGFIVKAKEIFFEKVLYLIKNKALREQMGKNAAEHCFGLFSEEIHLHQLRSLYGEVLND